MEKGSVIKCNWDLCTNHNDCFQKVSELNKNINVVINENNIYCANKTPEESSNNHQKNKIEKSNKYNVFHNDYFSKPISKLNTQSNTDFLYILNKNIEKIPGDNNKHSNKNKLNSKKRNVLEVINENEYFANICNIQKEIENIEEIICLDEDEEEEAQKAKERKKGKKEKRRENRKNIFKSQKQK